MAEEAAEETGQRISETNSGKSGIGPRYQFARRQRESLELQRDARQSEITQLRAKRDELRAAQAKIVADASVVREQEIAGIKAKRESLQRQIVDARADISRLEARKDASVETFRREVMASAHFHAKAKNDPLSRMTAYQELKSDAKDGETIVLFSWMTKLFVIFLEVVPVLAKMFFAPPSVYAARVQARVSGDRLGAQLPKGRPVEARQPAPAQRLSVTPAAPARPAAGVGPAPVQPRPAAAGPVVQAVRSNPQPAQPVQQRTAMSPPIAPAKPVANGAPLRPVGVSVQSVAPQDAALAADMERLVREARERQAANGGSRAAAT
jgi:hypothetical protein